jgi:radical SAM superfamily enzyme YgiQ (UPF0313 family)
MLFQPQVQRSDSLSLGYIAAFARQHDFEAEVVDLALAPARSLRSLAELVRERAPTLLGITAYQSTMPQVIGLARQLRDVSAAPIIIGGPQAAAMPDAGLAELDDVDLLCRGEGEVVCLELLKAQSTGRGLEAVPGITFKSPDGTLRTTPNPRPPEDLDGYPSPYQSGTIRPDTPVLLKASRGCPYACAFCASPFLTKRRVRAHSAQRVVDDIACCYEQGFRQFDLADECAGIRRRLFRELLSRIAESGMDITLSLEMRADTVDDEFLDLMQRAHVTRIFYGLETSDEELLARIGKNVRMADFERTVRATLARGIDVSAFHIPNLPGQTLWGALATIDYVRSLGLFLESGTVGSRLELFFGTEFCEHPDRWGITLPRGLRRPAYLSPGRDFRTREMGPVELGMVIERVRSELGVAHARRAAMATDATDPAGAHAFTVASTRAELLWGAGARLRFADQGPHELALCIADGPHPDRHVAALIERLPDLAFDFRLVLAGATARFPWGPLVDALAELLASTRLYQGQVSLAVSLAQWQHQRSAVEACIRRLLSTRPLGPGVSAGRLLAGVALLADLTDAVPGRDGDAYRAFYQFLARSGAELYPFFRIQRADHARRYAQIIRQHTELLHPKLVLVSCAPDAVPHLERLYDSRAELPTAVLLDGPVLHVHPGARPPASGAELRALRLGGEVRA